MRVQEQSDEAVFPTANGPWWRALPRFILAGALVGLIFWEVADRTFTTWHQLIWASGGAAFVSLFALDPLRKSFLREVRVRPDGFVLVRNRGEEFFTWSELEAAQFRDYAFHGMTEPVGCFRFRAGGKNREFIVPFGEAEAHQLRELIGGYLRAYGVPPQTAAMPTFERTLSEVAAWVFVLSIFAMMLAHRLAYHTLGTIFGLAFMLTGTVIALLTRRERLSRYVILATVVLAAGAVLIIWTCGINVRDVLIGWEATERRLGRAPW